MTAQPADILYQAGAVTIDPARFMATCDDGLCISLSPQLFQILAMLAREWPNTASKAAIANAVLSDPQKPNVGEHIAVLMFRLRERLPRDEYGRSMIATVRPLGWTLNVPVYARHRWP